MVTHPFQTSQTHSIQKPESSKGIFGLLVSVFRRQSETDPRLRKAYRQRSRQRERFSTPLRRTIVHRIEESCKRISVAWVGRRIAPAKISAPIDPASIRSILILRNDAIGDMILTTPFWRILKQQYPHLKIGIVGSFRNLPVIAYDADIDYRYECTGSAWSQVLRASRETRQKKWDVVLPMIYNKKTKMAILSKIFAPKAAASMVLLRDDPRDRYKQLFSICISSDWRKERDSILDLMRRHFEGTFKISFSEDQWRPSLALDESRLQPMAKELAGILETDGTRGYVHINLEAKTRFKEYGPQNTFELSRILRSRYPDLSIIWTTSPVNADTLDTFLGDHTLHGIHFVRTNSIFELIAIVRGADLVITPDTSVVHIASAEQRPVVGLYPFRHEWPPFKVPNVVLVPRKRKPVSTIPLPDVLRAVNQLMQAA